jgi:hypothetical protein
LASTRSRSRTTFGSTRSWAVRSPITFDLLRRLCDEAGRDYEAIEKTAPFAFDVGDDGSKVGELLDTLRWLAGMGIQMVSGWVVGVDRVTPMGREVTPAVADFR